MRRIKNRTIVLIFIVFVLFYSKTAIAQPVNIEYAYKHYTIQDGLVQMQVQSLFQDSKGYLWCGTKIGVSRFDGKTFKNYTSLDIKQNGPVAFFNEDKNNNLLIFNENNISVLKKDTVVSLNYPGEETLPETVFNAGNAPFSTITNKIYKRNRIVLCYKNPDSLYSFIPYQKKYKIIYFDENNNNIIWLAFQDTLVEFDRTKNRIINTFAKNSITYLKRQGNSLYGFSIKSGIFKLVNNKFIQILKHKFEGGQIKVICTPDNKSFIIKTLNHLYLYTNKITVIKKNMTHIRDIMFDIENNLWVATEEGLYNFFQLNFINYKFGMGNKDWVWSIVEDDKKNMWFTSYQNGIWKWDGEKITNYTKQLNKQRQHIYKNIYPYYYFMGASKSGSKLYFPTDINVLQFDGTGFKPVEGITTLPDNAFFIAKTDIDNNLYCGGMQGLYKISPDGSTKFWSVDSLDISTILSVEFNTDKDIIAIGSKGIAKIKKDTIIYHKHESLHKNFSSAKDHYNNVWIGGSQALDLLTNDTLIRVIQNTSELYFSLLFVKPHFLLLGGLNGLYVANLEDYYQNNIFEPVLYNHNNGFTGIECGQNGFFTDSEGFAWINTSDLVTRFDPQKLIRKEINPPNLYVNAQISDDNINWNPLQTNSGQLLKHNQNNLKFIFDAISFANIGNIRYYYRLTGLQDKWSEATYTNNVTFYHLQPGKYILSAKADPGISKAMSEIVTINFEIKKPVTQTWWFILSMILLTVLLIAAIVKILNNRFKKEELIKKKIVQLRATALKAQMNPHLIYNALNNINGLINLGHKKEAQEYLNIFSDMLRLVLESTNKNEITLENEFEIIKSFAEFHKQAQTNSFDFEIKSELDIDTRKVIIPPVLIQPFVENAILHGLSGLKNRKGRIVVTAKNAGNQLLITVEDNGIGLGNSKLKGNGLGTRLTKERIKLLENGNKNEVKIVNLEQGTQVTINIPLKQIQ